VSRLARSCKDWHQLLELCGLFQVLIGDADGVYDPTDANDRMLLGLRGMMSEAELHVPRSRLHQGKLNKARRGELFSCVPSGYVRSADGGIALDPDEQVRPVVALVFAKYAELGSVSTAHAFLVANGIQLGLRVYKGAGKGQLEWRRPRRGALSAMLCHPFYAGAYAYGRYPLDPTGQATGKSGRRRHAPPEGWLCLLRDKVPAYISWEQYEQNRRRLASHDAGRGRKTATGRAPTLLNGVVRCGRGGRPLLAHYTRPASHPRYACAHEFTEYGGPRCQSVTARHVDRLLEALVLRAVAPAALELSFRAAERAERDRQQLHDPWRQRLERAGYEAERARRQYDAVDPENRLVARALERQREEKLAAAQRLEEDYARFQSEQPRHLTASDRERIRALATDLPALWRAAATTGADRRAVVRPLVERVELTRRGTTERVEVVVHWRGGTASRQEVVQGLRGYTDLDRYDELKGRVIELRAAGLTAGQIAEDLNRAGYAVPRGDGYTDHRVRPLFAQLGLVGTPTGIRAGSDLAADEK
jgi:hypothetical protein